MTNKIKRMFLASILFLSGCRIDVSPTVKISDLKEGERNVPVLIYSSTETCDMFRIEEMESLLVKFVPIRWNGCTRSERPESKFMMVWQTNIPLLHQKDIDKLAYVDYSIFYSDNNSLILTFRPSFFNELEDKIKSLYNIKYKIGVSIDIVNDTNKPVKFALSGVFLNNTPVGEMQVYQIKAGGKTTIRLSDVGIDSLIKDGVEPIAVVPSLE